MPGLLSLCLLRSRSRVHAKREASAPVILQRTAQLGLGREAMRRSDALSYAITFVYDDVEFSSGRR